METYSLQAKPPGAGKKVGKAAEIERDDPGSPVADMFLSLSAMSRPETSGSFMLKLPPKPQQVSFSGRGTKSPPNICVRYSSATPRNPMPRSVRQLEW